MTFEPRPQAQIDSRNAFAAACRRSLTSASSLAARSMRSCCVSVRACWASARSFALSARSLTACSCLAMTSTVRVSSAKCSATLAMSSSTVTTARFYARQRPRGKPLVSTAGGPTPVCVTLDHAPIQIVCCSRPAGSRAIVCRALCAPAGRRAEEVRAMSANQGDSDA